jgi:hypothetical protein
VNPIGPLQLLSDPLSKPSLKIGVVPAAGFKAKFWVEVLPDVTVTVWLCVTYPEALVVTAYVPGTTLLRLNCPLALVVVLPPL